MSDDLSDPMLLARARDGEERAFVLLYERHRDPVFRFAYRMLGSVEAAEDVAHDCFLGLMTQPLRFDPSRASLLTYLCGAARNLSFKRLRSEGHELAGDAGPEPAIDGPALTSLLEDEVAREVRTAVGALPPLQKEVVILVDYEGLSLAEVAAIVGAEVGTVKARLHRARESLRRRLGSLRSHVTTAERNGDGR
ncbi:MAG TPA: RNA polymerase sigma factor [Vicinamibacteria bacterium]|jgi:RNA polymerase sigma-70 factor (ECF subfamily)